MKTEKVNLSQVKVNKANPRFITDKKLRLLVERLLAFPKMISLRPVVVDETMTALGGNMRIRAYNEIAAMGIEEIGKILAGTKNFQRLTSAERKSLLEQWQVWLDKPTVEIARASELSDAEKKEFIIADNASFGTWDYERLANEWDAEELTSWGVDVWKPDEEVDTNDLPPELQGIDINPGDLPDIQGTDEVAMERIIIVYPKERADEVAQLIGIGNIDKVVYSIEELIPTAE